MIIMLKKLYPHAHVESVFTINYERLAEQGFKAVLFDVDNTLVYHGEPSTSTIDALIDQVKRAGLTVMLVSNNSHERISDFSQNMAVDFIPLADKPKPDAYIQAIEMLKLSKNEVVFVGDQLFTDILGANRAGIPSILVDFIRKDWETKFGKKRFLEKIILSFYRRNKQLYNRLGQIHKGVN